MDYRLAAAMRGPDHVNTAGAFEWKYLVTAPLRWMAATLLGEEPRIWSFGLVYSPDEALKDAPVLKFAAKEFAQSMGSRHVLEHAMTAFQYLLTTDQRENAERLQKELLALGLL